MNKPIYLHSINRLFLRDYQREWLFLIYGSRAGYQAHWHRPWR